MKTVDLPEKFGLGVGLLDFVLRVLRTVAETDNHGVLWWRTDGGYAPISFFVNCNDLFFWACSDLEEITPENIGDLEQAIADTKSTLGVEGWDVAGEAYELFCARMRGMRPQQPCYKNFPEEMKPLFDACGPPRDPKNEG